MRFSTIVTLVKVFIVFASTVLLSLLLIERNSGVDSIDSACLFFLYYNVIGFLQFFYYIIKCGEALINKMQIDIVDTMAVLVFLIFFYFTS